MRCVPNMYILNLATSDIIYVTVLFSKTCANRISDMWLHRDIMCRFLPFCRCLSVSLSVYSGAVYSNQQYRVTVKLPRPSLFTGNMACYCGYNLSSVAALFAIPSVLSKYLCEEFRVLRPETYYQHVVIFELLVTCVLPLCVIAFTYIMTSHHLVESSCSVSEGTQNPLVLYLKGHKILN